MAVVVVGTQVVQETVVKVPAVADMAITKAVVEVEQVAGARIPQPTQTITIDQELLMMFLVKVTVLVAMVF